MNQFWQPKAVFVTRTRLSDMQVPSLAPKPEVRRPGPPKPEPKPGATRGTRLRARETQLN